MTAADFAQVKPATETTVVHYQRCPDDSAFSVERLFSDIRAAMPGKVRIVVRTCRFQSRGFFKRLYNTAEAYFRQGTVNHVTGDVTYLACALNPRRTILTVLDCGSLARLNGWKRSVYRLFWFTLPARRSAVVVAISNFTRSQLLHYGCCSPEKVRVIPVPVGTAFRPMPKAFRADHPVLLQVGTTANKNIECLAKALEGISCRLEIVGNLSNTQAEALKNANVEYTVTAGLSDEELLEKFRQCDIVTFASTYEGFGLPIVEANAIGRPVVTSNAASMPEVAGEAAVLVDPHDPASIRQGILNIIEDSHFRDELIAKGYRNAARFSSAAIAARYLNLYDELLHAL